jgi:Outer membrane efflux protein
MFRFFRNSTPTLATIAVLVGLLVPKISSFAAEQNVGASEKIKDLLKKRAASAKELYEIVRAANQSGSNIIYNDDVHNAAVVYRNAVLDLSDTKDERLKVLEDIVTEAEQWKDIVSKQVQAGRPGKSDLDRLKAEIYYYEASIKLEKAKQE